MIRLTLVVFLASLVHLSGGNDVDLTTVAGTSGENVVIAVINQIKDSCVFQNDFLFLKRLAYVNSNYGTSADTYRSGYDGGIWQVDLSQYEETLSGTSFNDIEAAFGIKWTSTTWSDLRKPLFSGIGMMLLIELHSSSEPKTILEQAKFYESELNGDESMFTDLVTTMSAGCLSDNLDMAFLIDASGSIVYSDYMKSKQFVADILDAFNIDNDAVRISVTTFSTRVNPYVYFSDHQDRATLQQKITNLPYDGQMTNTGLALEYLREVVFTEGKGMRSASAKIAIVQTDGRSQDTARTLEAAQSLREEGVTIFAIGVGNSVYEYELDGIATSPTCRHKRQINDFDELHSIVADIDDGACETLIDIHNEIDTDLTCDMDVTISLKIADENTVVVVGDVTLFGSYDIDRPSSALYSFSVYAESALPTMIYSPASDVNVSITIDTSNCTGDYVLQVLEGKQLIKTGSATHCSKNNLDGRQELQSCAEIDYVTSNKFTTDNDAQTFCASVPNGYHAQPNNTLQYFYCDAHESYHVDCPAGFGYVHAHEDCCAPASTESDDICDICTSFNIRMNLLAFPLATNDYQFVYCYGVDFCGLEECASEYIPGGQSCKTEWVATVGCFSLDPNRRRIGCDNSGGGAGGDPHFRMWDNKHFSYHGQCDLVLMRSQTFASGLGLEVHIRTKIKNHYSFINGLAVKLGNDYFEMDKDKFYFNGRLHEHPLENFAGYPLEKIEVAAWCRDKCANAKIYRMLFDDGYIEMANMVGFLHVEFRGIFDDAMGLLGTSGKTGTFGRNGTLVVDVNEYGSEWQVTENDPVLFQNRGYPQHPDNCILPKESSRRRKIDPVTRRMAEDACSDLPNPLKDMCKFDVEATGNKDMALSPIFFRY